VAKTHAPGLLRAMLARLTGVQTKDYALQMKERNHEAGEK